MKALYYIENFLINTLPKKFFILEKKSLEKRYRFHKNEIENRVNYYCKKDSQFFLEETASVKIKDFKKRGQSAYFYDLKRFLNYFPENNKFSYHFGDETEVIGCPSIYKARPVHEGNSNSVLFKLNKKRHFKFVSDKLKYKDKKNKAIFRGNVTQQHRIEFMEKMYGHPLLDAGQLNYSKERPEFHRGFTSMKEQLKYKFIVCLEGNDVASNLKWVMSSNSIAITPRMRYETWFMEGRLIPGVHYIEVLDDWSDFQDQLDYYLAHPDEAEKIITNAKKHVAMFKDENFEKIICIKTLEKYFSLCKETNLKKKEVRNN